MKLTTKLVLLCGLPILALAISVGSSFWVAKTIERGLSQSMDEGAVYADLARSLQINVIQVQQFLTDISATRGQNGLDDGFEEAEQNRKEFFAGLARFRTYYEKTGRTDALATLDTIGKQFQSYFETGHRMADAYIKDGTTAGNQLMGAFDQSSEELTKAFDPFVAAQIEQFTKSIASVQATARNTTRTNTAMALILTLLTGMILFVARSVPGPFRKIVSVLSISAGRATETSNHVAGNSQELAAGASQSAASLEETSASLEEMTTMTKRTASNANAAKELGSATRAAAEVGAADMQNMSAAMLGIQTSSDNIAKIIKTIDEIAFQTNLLALNAAVEAARAGEAGMGFAVVADEVRALAQRSAQAAKETATKIEDSIAKSQHGVQISTKVNASLIEIVSKARAMDELINEIAVATNEQSQGIVQINSAIGLLDRVTQATSATSNSIAGAAESLREQSTSLTTGIAQLTQLVGAGATALTSPTQPAMAATPTPSKAFQNPRNPKNKLMLDQAQSGFAASLPTKAYGSESAKKSF